MIAINRERQFLDKLAKDWANDLRSFLTDDLKTGHELKSSVKKPYITFFKRRNKYLYVFEKNCSDKGLDAATITEGKDVITNWLSNLEDYVTADESDLLKFKASHSAFTGKPYKEYLKDFFVTIYLDFTALYAYKYFERLNLRTCPYCNRHYTFTLKREKANNFQTRPEMDHFHDKSDYPMLALSFYNLVPSCHECNHGKLKKDAGVNPYFHGFKSKFVLTNDSGLLDANKIRAIKETTEFSVSFDNPTSEEQTNIDTLGLDKLYNEHKDYVLEMVEKAVTYDDCLRHGIVDNFQGVFRSEHDVFNLVWGKYLSDAEQEKRPLSKLTKDILEQLDIQ